MRPRMIGVLGGMGPAATVDFLGKIVAATPAERDQDHIPILAYIMPDIPDRSSAIAEGSDAPLAPMLKGLKALEDAGAEVLAVPCNTAHFWYAQIAQACSRPLLNIVEAAVEDAVRRGELRVGLMATRGAIAAGLYQERLLAAGLEPILPDETTQRLIDSAIQAVKTGRSGSEPALQAADALKAAGAQTVILACTELPIALAGASLDFIDTADSLARSCVRAAFAPRERPAGPGHDLHANPVSC